jgi:hypothetical protein
MRSFFKGSHKTKSNRYEYTKNRFFILNPFQKSPVNFGAGSWKSDLNRFFLKIYSCLGESEYSPVASARPIPPPNPPKNIEARPGEGLLKPRWEAGDLSRRVGPKAGPTPTGL